MFGRKAGTRAACYLIPFFVLVGLPGVSLAACGDSWPDAGEQCDDGNTASGDGCSDICTIEPGFDCTAALPGSVPENILVDGSFENGNVGGEWTSINHSLFGANLICGDSCFGQSLAADRDGSLTSGNYVLVAGGTFSGPSAGNVTHAAVSVPADATTLEFQWATLLSGPHGDPCTDATDGLTLSIGGTQVWSNTDAGPCTIVSPYERVVIDLATAPGGPYQGATVGFEFLGSATGIPPSVGLTNVMLDDVSLNVPEQNPFPPTPSACTAQVCGDSVLSSTEQCDDGNAVSGDGCSASCTVEQPNFVCTDPVPPADSGDDIVDGGFESGPDAGAWVQTGTVFEPICSQALCGSALANDGAFYASFGHSDQPNVQTLSQLVTISPTSTELKFDLLVSTCDSSADALTVQIGGFEVYRYDCTAQLPTYQAQSVGIAAFADGEQHLVEFIGATFAANGGPSTFLVDNVSIEDNVPFAGAPGICTELPTSCGEAATFDEGIPGDWTVVNASQDPADGWENSVGGVCASQNWSSADPDNNETGGGGPAACADSDATGQIDVDAGGAPLEMDTYLCTPGMNLTEVTGPALGFLVNYQAADNALNDNNTPADSSDDFDDDFLDVLIGDEAPTLATLPGYTRLTGVVDHLDTTLSLSGRQSMLVDLGAFADDQQAWICFHYRARYAWFAQIDNVALRAQSCSPPPDSDDDGVPDTDDNCTLIANADQRDTNGDGIGNRCDADLNDDCLVNFGDLAAIKAAFFPINTPDEDFDGDGLVNFADLALMKSTFFDTATPGPGPGAPGNACEG